MKKKKQLKAGGIVQIWDSGGPFECFETPFMGHGQVGYLVQSFGDTGEKTPEGWTSSSGSIWEVICFGQDPPVKHKVHESWLNPIDKYSDIKKVEGE